jgi:hypothetical protein
MKLRSRFRPISDIHCPEWVATKHPVALVSRPGCVRLFSMTGESRIAARCGLPHVLVLGQRDALVHGQAADLGKGVREATVKGQSSANTPRRPSALHLGAVLRRAELLRPGADPRDSTWLHALVVLGDGTFSGDSTHFHSARCAGVAFRNDSPALFGVEC